MIPVPPFADVDEARLFTFQLALHIASMDGDRVSLPTFAVLSALDESTRSLRGRRPGDGRPLELPSSVLRLAVLMRFPAPWTPQGLHTAIQAGDAWATRPPVVSDRLGRGSDPITTGERGADGLWTVTVSERGTDTVIRRGLDDDSYVQVILDDARGFPFPYGWESRDLEDHDALTAGGRETARRWTDGWATMPYLTSWIAERDDSVRRAEA